LSAGHVIQPVIAIVASLDFADSDGDLRLNRDLIIGNPIGMSNEDVVIPNTSYCQ
jgi:hypothetical protein